MSSGSYLVLAAVLASALSGCSTGPTTAYVRTDPSPPTERIRLVRPDVEPIVAEWTQEESTLVGQLAFAKACQTETVQLTRRTRVSETRPNRNYVIGSYLAGALLSAAGIGFIANSVGKSERVTCETGKCASQASAWRALGILTLAGGVGAIVGGVFVQKATPRVESTELPSEERVVAVANAGDCGNAQALDGAVVHAALSSGGSWNGVVDRSGVVRIDLAGAAYTRGARRASASIRSTPGRWRSR